MDFPIPITDFEKEGNDPEEGSGLYVVKARNAAELQARANELLDQIAAENDESVVVGMSLGGVGDGQTFVLTLTVQGNVQGPDLQSQVPIGPPDPNVADPTLKLGARVFCTETAGDGNDIAAIFGARGEALGAALAAVPPPEGPRNANVYEIECEGAGAAQQQVAAALYNVVNGP